MQDTSKPPSNQSQLTTRPLDNVEIFCLHYLKNFDHNTAWRLAHPDSKNKKPSNASWKFLNTERVQARLRELAREFLTDLEQDVRDIIAETKAIASLNPFDFMDINEDGEPELNLAKCKDKPEVLRLLNIEFGRAVDKDGGRHQVYKIKAYDKMDALEKLYKYYKLYAAAGYEDKPQAINVNVQFPLPGEYWRSNTTPPKYITDIIEGE